MKFLSKKIFIAFLLAFSSSFVFAGEADVVNVKVSKAGEGKWRFDVTVRHEDTGWEHYANRWDVLTPDGTVLGSRILHHPHVEEQPFTRSAVISVPKDVKQVVVRANDLVDGLGGKEIIVSLP